MSTLALAGFDLVHAFDARVAPWLLHDRAAVLVGNTRALWAPFCAAMTDPALATAADPLDRYTEVTIDAAYPGARIYYAHRAYDGAFLPFQQLAAAAGMAALAPTHLAIHPIHGPWFALRAVVLLDEPAPVAPPRIAKACVCTGACEAAFAAASTRPDDWQAWLAMRDACSLRGARYTAAQIRFHYTKIWESRQQTPR